MQMTNRIRYTAAEVQRNTFYQMPKFLFDDEFKGLSNDARVLYSLLRDRHELSLKNQWLNENDEVYLIFSRENMCEMLNLSEKTVTKAMNDLKKHRLVDVQRRGQGKTNLIYLLNLESLDFTKKGKISPSRQGKFPLQGRENFPTNNTNISKTDGSHSQGQSQIKTDKGITVTNIEENNLTMTYDNDIAQPSLLPHGQTLQITDSMAEDLQLSSINAQYHAINHRQNKEAVGKVQQNEYTTYREILHRNIDYDRYLRVEERTLVDELMDCILDVICTKGETVRINGEDKSREMVKGQYLKLNNDDIEHVLSRYKGQKHQITHVHSYLKTMLYTVRQENGHYYTNAVRVDGLVM